MKLERKIQQSGFLQRAWRRLKNRVAGRRQAAPSRLADIDPEDLRIIDQVRPYTMTSRERLLALINAVPYIIRRDIPGVFVECGVWRGGSVLAMLLKLQQLGVNDRDVYLFDTFEGMTQPTELDVSPYTRPALEAWNDASESGRRAWEDAFRPEVFNEDSVRQLLVSSGYPAERLHLVKGPVEQTLPGPLTGPVALLRLDTDWYESTRHELEHLYPRLSTGGVLIIDDYGHWQGCRRAVDEYFNDGAARPILLNRVDYTARIGIKD